MTRLLPAAMTAVLVSASCSKDPQPEQPPEPPAAPPTPMPAPAATPASSPTTTVGGEPTTQVPKDQLPTQEDFEAEAEQKITASNLQAALAELEEEIKD